MFKKRLLWYLFPSYLLIIVFFLVLTTFYTTYTFKDFYFKKVESNQETIIELYENDFINALETNNLIELNRLSKDLAKKASIRLTIIAPDGKVLSDSEENPTFMENHSDRPEVKEAFIGKISNSIRYSSTLKKNMLYVALPLKNNGIFMGVIRTSVPLTLLEHNLNNLYEKIIFGGIITSLFAVFMSYWFTRKLKKPLLILEDSALKFAEGDFSSKVPISPIKEIGGLAEAMNIMADKLKHLENIRKDFVANVSHELKTPVTSIKGFIETLQDGAIDNPEEAKHFLDIISRHTNRLNAIIEDLLSLSRLENTSLAENRLEKQKLLPVLESAIQLCETNAANKFIKIHLECSPEIKANIDSLLFEQAIVNLIDNAIKYSPENKEIKLITAITDNEIKIMIEDQGFGIPEEHLPRIFERFYRVDKARSRKAGGTGLGLSIVKHIINAHKGTITVSSEINKGSVFTITLPI
jgi:two-component system phosphate regulon sensor histidine kinase PhoR